MKTLDLDHLISQAKADDKAVERLAFAFETRLQARLRKRPSLARPAAIASAGLLCLILYFLANFSMDFIRDDESQFFNQLEEYLAMNFSDDGMNETDDD